MAHIDHGKSTAIACWKTSTIDSAISEQTLDDMDLSGSAASRSGPRLVAAYATRWTISSTIEPGRHPGASIFNTKSRACCEGAVLVVDAFQASRPKPWPMPTRPWKIITIVPVLNKVDLKHARPDEVAEMESVLAIPPEEVLHCSGKTGVARNCCGPSWNAFRLQGDPGALQAMVFDSHYDEFRGRSRTSAS